MNGTKMLFIFSLIAMISVVNSISLFISVFGWPLLLQLPMLPKKKN